PFGFPAHSAGHHPAAISYPATITASELPKSTAGCNDVNFFCVTFYATSRSSPRSGLLRDMAPSHEPLACISASGNDPKHQTGTRPDSMSYALVVDLARNAIMTAMLLAGPLLIVALGTGLVISVVQAVTQIQEQTLSFVPKLFAVAAVFLFALPWM